MNFTVSNFHESWLLKEINQINGKLLDEATKKYFFNVMVIIKR